ncbi:MAG: GlsB/YeaQ/YmgE family stress response membrane protein [Pirellula sp.]|nr:GlsB/YeaQ/YmgE family stress response membrane protein [Pirellula sp.]
MGILAWIVFGLIAGATAKFVLPGRDPGGIVVTILIGIAGAVIGGLIGTGVGFGPITGFNAASMMIAVFGAILLLFVFRLLVDRSKA